MLTFDYDSLFNKSRQFIAKSIAARETGQLDECQLWAAFALEILAKAVLAKINPALVADPRHDESLFAACGIPVKLSQKNHRTINAKTAYTRIRNLPPKTPTFDYDFCVDITERRSAQLHSGETPYVIMKLDDWMPKYWSACKVLLKLQDLSDWIDADEAKMVEDVIHKRMTALRHSVVAKIQSSQQQFKARYPEGSIKLQSLQQLEQRREAESPKPKLYTASIPWKKYPYEIIVPARTIKLEQCPACCYQGELACKRMHDNPIVVEPFEYHTIVEYTPTEFRCDICGLELKGSEELAEARMETDPLQAEFVNVGG